MYRLKYSFPSLVIIILKTRFVRVIEPFKQTTRDIVENPGVCSGFYVCEVILRSGVRNVNVMGLVLK